MENITQTAKFTAKAIVLAAKAEICSRLSAVLVALAVVTMAPLPQFSRLVRLESRDRWRPLRRR